jgi:hypothetical protein
VEVEGSRQGEGRRKWGRVKKSGGGGGGGGGGEEEGRE